MPHRSLIMLWIISVIAIGTLGVGSLTHAQTVTRAIERSSGSSGMSGDSSVNDDEVWLVRFFSGGVSEPRGRGLTVLDNDDKPVAFRPIAHDPDGQTLLAIQPRSARQPLRLVYGSKVQSNIRIDDSITPSLVLTMYAADRRLPNSFQDALASFGNARSIGAKLVPQISIGHNPFGGSGSVLAMFEGQITADPSGTYRLISVNDGPAFVEIDGRVVIQHTDRHIERDAERLARGATSVQLEVGKHRIRYIYAAGDARPLAQLGYVRDDRVHVVPPDWFARSPIARLGPAKVEGPKPIVGFDAAQIGQFLTEHGLFTLMALRPIGKPPEGAHYRWDFGDGGMLDPILDVAPSAASTRPSADASSRLAASAGRRGDAHAGPVRGDRRGSRRGQPRQLVNIDDTSTFTLDELADAPGFPSRIEHVFVTPVNPDGTMHGPPPAWRVTLELVDGKKTVLARSVATIRPDNDTQTLSLEDSGAVQRFAAAISGCDYEKMQPEPMVALFHFLQMTERYELMATIAEPYVRKFGGRGGEIGWTIRHALATYLANEHPADAEKLFGELALNAPDTWRGTCAAAEQLDLWLYRLNKTDDIERRASAYLSNRQPRERALIRSRLGDFHRLAGRTDRATEYYREAQRDSSRTMEPRQAAVLERAYREQALSLLEQRRLIQMRDTLFQWEADFPLAKMGGDLPLLLGRYFLAQGDNARAIAEFRGMLAINPLHPSKPEILYRLAQALKHSGQIDEGDKLFEQLHREFPNSSAGRDLDSND